MDIAIQQDEVFQRNGKRQSFSERWLELAEAAGVNAELINAWDENALSRLASFDGFMWRFQPDYAPRTYAQRFLNTVEHGLRLPVFPDWRTRWYVEDKISQQQICRAIGVNTPRTWLFWEKSAALAFLQNTEYPLVLKLSSGFQSRNVRLLKSREEGVYYARQLFGPGLTSLGYQPAGLPRRAARAFRGAAQGFLLDLTGHRPTKGELSRDYMYLQEFVPQNEYDTRVTVIGERAFAFRRFNRPNDFRASGSGLLDWDPENIDQRIVRLAFQISDHLQSQTVSIDAIYRGEDIVVLELTLLFPSWMVKECPGHWCRLNGGGLRWVDGKMPAEDAIFQDFVSRLKNESKLTVH